MDLITLTMLAQTQPPLPDPNHFASIGWVCVSLVCIILGLRAGIGLVRDMKDQPHPSVVQRESAEKFLPKTEFEKHVEVNRLEHENLFSKLGGVERGLRGEFVKELALVRSEMNQTTSALASLRTSAEMLNQSISAERARLDRAIERDIRT